MQPSDNDETGIMFPAELWQKTLDCPVCGFHCVHLVSCTVEQQTQRVRVTSLHLFQRTMPPSGRRGSVITIEAYCEEGHRFVWVMAFHKGSVYAHHERLPDCPPDPETGFTAPDELWRD